MSLSPRTRLVVAAFLCLVPVTLLVPGLHELVTVRHGGSEGEAHAFMTVNLLAGMIAVPLTLRRLRRRQGDLRAWIATALTLDALCFLAMAAAPSLPWLMLARSLEGAAHLPAITLLMVAANRLAGERRGAALGIVAGAIMIGVAVGSPVGGVLVTRGPAFVYATGMTLLILGALFALGLPAIQITPPSRARYAFDGRRAATWIPLAYGFLDRFSIGVFVSTFTLYMTNVLGLSAPMRGVMIAMFMLPFALLSYPVGRLADRVGWFRPLLAGNVGFGLVFALYGHVTVPWLPVLMLASGVFSALMFTPNLLLISDLARSGAGDGLFGAFQMAGSLGFLTGPIVGGILVQLTRDALGVPAYAPIFTAVGLLAVALSLISWRVLRPLSESL